MVEQSTVTKCSCGILKCVCQTIEHMPVVLSIYEMRLNAAVLNYARWLVNTKETSVLYVATTNVHAHLAFITRVPEPRVLEFLPKD